MTVPRPFPTEFPDPDSPAYARLSADEQAWLDLARPWFARGSAAAHPSRALLHPVLAVFASDLPRHSSYLIKYYLTFPALFRLTLEQLTGQKFPHPTAVASQDAWRRWAEATYQIRIAA